MGTLIHSIIKIQYSAKGYLPNYPYHLISDTEMIHAFISDDESIPTFFSDMYPLIDDSLVDEYTALKESISYHVNYYLAHPESYMIPDWVYAYMLGTVVSVNSPALDKHDLFTLMNLDNVDDEFTPEIAKSCYQISKQWLSKLSSREREHRSPTIFGEPHVIKYLRLLNSEVI